MGDEPMISSPSFPSRKEDDGGMETPTRALFLSPMILSDSEPNTPSSTESGSRRRKRKRECLSALLHPDRPSKILNEVSGSESEVNVGLSSSSEFNQHIDFAHKFPRSQSESAVTLTIKHAMDQKHNDPLLIGDCSRQYLLPFITDGRHHDLKEISGETLVQLLCGEIEVQYTVIDCRYPYEYAGGHVKGAINLYTEAQVYKKYFEERSDLEGPKSGREVLIFHCEFSVERGPRMCRNVRSWDRTANFSTFPALFYPEMYVLHGGYKGFYENHPSHCLPQEYCKMVDDAEQLRFYKNKCKNELVRRNSKLLPTIKSGRQITTIKKLLI